VSDKIFRVAVQLSSKESAVSYLQEQFEGIQAQAIRDAADKVLRHNHAGFCIHCTMHDYANELTPGGRVIESAIVRSEVVK